jgi:hypothetical protein
MVEKDVWMGLWIQFGKGIDPCEDSGGQQTSAKKSALVYKK